VDLWGFAAIVAPGIALILAGNVLIFRAHEQAERQRTARIIMLGFTLLYLIPGCSFAVLVLLGRMQPVALIGAAVLIGFALLHIYVMRSN
jgi:hypothetical protein